MHARRIGLAVASLAALAGFSILPAAAASAATTYSDTGFVVLAPHDTCGTTPSALTWTATPAGEITTGVPSTGDTLTVGSASTVPGLSSTTNTNGSLTIKGTVGDSVTAGKVVVLETFGGCTVADTISPVNETSSTGFIVPATAAGTAALDTITSLTFSYVVGGVQFAGMPAGGSFAFSTPAGVVTSAGELVLAGSTAHPGLYTSQGVTYTDTLGASQVDSFGLDVKAIATHTPTTHVYGPGTVVNSNGFCLDARGVFGVQEATTLQIWKCGAAGGEDQEFVFTETHGTGTLAYQDATGHTGFCVTSTGVNQVATLAPCGGAGQQVSFSDGVYRFANGAVLDNAALRNVNGNRVLTWVFNGGRNQFWSLPE